MYITPIIPSSCTITLDNDLIKRAEKLITESAKLTGGIITNLLML